MTITSNDIKIFQAQDNTDNDSGGGSRTANVIIDGAVNNLFPDISRIDTVSGDVALRKVFPTVFTANSDLYYGAHAMVRKVPADPKVSALLFHTDSPHDKRIDAQNDIESYVVASYLEQFYLYGNHVVGAKAVTFLQTVESLPPSVGEVYLLKEGNNEQYVRITDMDTLVVNLTFTAGSSITSHKRRRVICQIDQALEYAFKGSSFHPSGQMSDTADTWATQIADAAKFYSTKTLSENALLGDTSIKVDSIFEQLVPASIIKKPLVNLQALTQGVGLLPSGYVITVAPGFTQNIPTAVGSAIVPGSITRINTTGYVDDGLGNIISINQNNAIVGTVDYENGIITQSFLNGGFITYEVATSYEPYIQFTGGIAITQESSGNTFTKRLSPMPSIGNLYVDYRSQGKWYRFASTGQRIGNNETISGENIGSGNLTDNLDGTGTASITLAALPDLDSEVIISWGSAERPIDRSGVVQSTDTYAEIDLGQTNIDPLTLNISVYSPNHGAYKIISSDANGVLVDAATGNFKAVGVLDAVNGLVRINSSGGRFDLAGSVRDVSINFDYANIAPGNAGEIKAGVAKASPIGTDKALTESPGVLTFNLGESPDLKTVRFSFLVDLVVSGSIYPVPQRKTISATTRVDGTVVGTHGITGTVAANGDVTLNVPQRTIRKRNPAFVGTFGTEPRYITEIIYHSLNANAVTFQYQLTAPAAHNLSGVIVDKIENLMKYKIYVDGDITGEVIFSLSHINAKTYSSDGGVVKYINEEVGTINKATGEILLNYLAEPGTMVVDFKMLNTDELGKAEADFITTAVFKTAASKVTTSGRYKSPEGTAHIGYRKKV